MRKWDEAPPTAPLGSPLSESHSPAEQASQRPHSQPPSLPDYIVRDIVAHVQQALGRFGVAGQVQYHSTYLFLDADVPSPQVSLEPWAAGWAQMDEGARRHRAEDVAKTLGAYRSTPPRSLPPRTPLVIDYKLVVAVVLLLGSLLWVFFGGDDTPSASRGGDGDSGAFDDSGGDGKATSQSDLSVTKEVATTGRSQGEARSSRVCAATLTRVFQGGSVSVADVDGFRVEIALLDEGGKQPLDTHPALKNFVQDPAAATGSPFIWEKEKDLAPVKTSDSVVTVRRLTIGEGSERINGVTLSFAGSLVDPYFKEAERGRFLHIATALSEALQATHGAVYARCFDRPLHALGSWFRGLDAGSAAASLVYFMGTYARPMHVAKPYTQLPGEQEMNRLHAFRSITQKTKPLTRADLATLIGKDGGMATGKDGDRVLITFPFGDGNRASRSSRSIARVTSLGL